MLACFCAWLLLARLCALAHIIARTFLLSFSKKYSLGVEFCSCIFFFVFYLVRTKWVLSKYCAFFAIKKCPCSCCHISRLLACFTCLYHLFLRLYICIDVFSVWLGCLFVLIIFFDNLFISNFALFVVAGFLVTTYPRFAQFFVLSVYFFFALDFRTFCLDTLLLVLSSFSFFPFLLDTLCCCLSFLRFDHFCSGRIFCLFFVFSCSSLRACIADSPWMHGGYLSTLHPPTIPL